MLDRLVRLFWWFDRWGDFIAIGVTVFLMACWALGITL